MKTRNTLLKKFAAVAATTLLFGAVTPLFADHDEDDRRDGRFGEREEYGERSDRDRFDNDNRDFGRRNSYESYRREELRRDIEERRDDAYRYQRGNRFSFGFGFNNNRGERCRD